MCLSKRESQPSSGTSTAMSNVAIIKSGLQTVDAAGNTEQGRSEKHQLISKMHSVSICLAPKIITVYL